MSQSKRIFLFTLLILLAILFSVEAVVLYGYNSLTKTKVYAVETFVVPEGASLISIVHQMKQQGLIDHELFLKSYLYFRQLPLIVKAGEYDFLGPYSALGLLKKLQQGEYKKYSVSFIEGTRLRDFLKILWSEPKITPTLRGYSDQEIAQRLGILESEPEGLFFPDTYFYSGDTTDALLLKRAHDRMQKVLADAWAKRAEKLPYAKPYQALIMASIIEKEAHLAREQPIIAGVFIRRMAIGMRLQTDPTVIYGLGQTFNGNLTRFDLLMDTPYNSYTRSGLPPTPIAAPGKTAIEAALHPASGTALYFVSKGDGSHYFSSTLEEHQRAVEKYQLGR